MPRERKGSSMTQTQTKTSPEQKHAEHKHGEHKHSGECSTDKAKQGSEKEGSCGSSSGQKGSCG
jgi:hypothetical protein